MPSNDPLLENEQLSSRTFQNLRSTSTWTRSFGVIGYILSFFLMISLLGAVPSMFDANSDSMVWPLLGLAFMISMLGVSFYLSFTLFNYGSSTKRFTETTDYAQLGVAFKRQLIYWRWMGIIISIILGFYVFYFAFFLILGMSQGT